MFESCESPIADHSLGFLLLYDCSRYLEDALPEPNPAKYLTMSMGITSTARSK
ncbi:MAG: hypothetical protein ACJAYS_000443 [Lentimonas sp.]|jgi:hypothetical protein